MLWRADPRRKVMYDLSIAVYRLLQLNILEQQAVIISHFL